MVLVAPSGSGKSTMANKLLADFDQLRFSVSATTRSPRKGEEHGKHYYYLTRQEFREKIEAGDFLEWEEFYNGNLYGTLRDAVENQRDKGYFVLLDIEVLGAVNVKKMYGSDALCIFIQPPSLKVLKQRLTDRGTENDSTLATRLERAEKEIAYADQFDLRVINDNVDTAYAKIKAAVSKFMNA